MTHADETNDSASFPIVDLKEQLQQWLAELAPALRTGTPGQEITADVSRRWDALLKTQFERNLADRADDCVLFALGGYGRREMVPFSDVDLMIVVPPEDEAILSRVENFIRTLWAAGVKLGHSVRTPQQVDELAGENMHVATSLLDSRHVCGSTALLPDPRERVRLVLQGESRDAFVQAIYDGVMLRRNKFGNSAHLLEPQVKLGRGGLRDLHALIWVSRLLFGVNNISDLAERQVVSRTEVRRLEAAHSFLLRTRFALHVHHRWKQDQLSFGAQRRLATMMGYGEAHVSESLTRFMQSYYLHAKATADLCDLWLDTWRISDGDPKLGHSWRHPSSDEQDPDPMVVFRWLKTAQRQKVRLHPETRRQISLRAPKLPPTVALDQTAARIVRRIICDLDDSGGLLQTVADTGVLAKVIPEWRHLVAHAHNDTYHVYTTDVHLLACAEKIKALIRGDLDEHLPYQSRVAAHYRQTGQVEALILAVLLHDIGKRMMADHSVIGAGLAAEAARRMGFSRAEQQLIRRLLLEHLTMPKVSQRRDIRDASTLRAFCGSIPDQSFLDALCVLSFADMDSVGPGHLNAWKLKLLNELHQAASEYLSFSSTHEFEAVSEQPQQVLRRRLAGHLSERRILELQSMLPARLLRTTDVPVLVRVSGILEDLTAPQVLFEDAPDGSFTQVLVLEPSPPSKIAEVAGVLGAAGLDIRSARTWPVAGAGMLDFFQVQTGDQAQLSVPTRKRDTLRAQITKVLQQGGFQRILTQKLSQSRLPPRKRPDVRLRVVIDQHFDPNFTIVEVKALDEPGLLAYLARTLSDLDLLLDRSIISTEGDRAIDTFYVRDSDKQKLTDSQAQQVRTRLIERLRALKSHDSSV